MFHSQKIDNFQYEPYQYHLFFCTNQREQPQTCCANHNTTALCLYAKQRVKELGLNQPGGVRISSAGCLGRCRLGPSLVIYPDGIWYRCTSEEVFDIILTEHIIGGKIIERYLMNENSSL